MLSRRFLALGGAALMTIAAWVEPAAILAQQSRARIDGVVTDSVHATPLVGALVLLARRSADTDISASATTDASGRFVFSDLPAGEYVVALESALLDSLEISLAPTTVTLAMGERRQLEIGIPSAATLKALMCPDALLPPGIGAVSGRVSSASDGMPLHGAALRIGWTETTVDRTTLRATNVAEGVEMATDSLGRFRVCGVPTDTYLDLRATLDGFRELVLQVVVDESAGVARQTLALRPLKEAIDVVAQRDSAAKAPAAAATLSGIVYGATAPLSRVQLQRRGDSLVISTDSLGRYRFSDIPVGSQLVELRRVGYLPRQLDIDVHPGDNRAPEVHLTPIATLDSIRVVAQRSRYREFESRAKAASFGHFLRAEDIEKKRPLLTSDLLRQMPGFKVVRSSTSDLDVGVVATSGPVSWTNPGTCQVKIFIDGVPNQMINWIDPYSIGAMEIYPGTATGPVQYQSPCGTILIWTRRP